MTEIEALQLLVSQPLEFLRKNSFSALDLGGQARVATFYMTNRLNPNITHPGKFLGNLSRKSGEQFQARDSAVMGGLPFQAIYIPVQPSNIAINAFPLSTVGPGTNLMLSTQLTGCCIVMVPGGGTFSVAHLQPTNETGIAMRQRLAASGIKAFGTGDYAAVSRATLVGARINGDWRFFTQTQDAYLNVTDVRELN